MKRTGFTTDPKKARRQQREWRERSVKRYEERVAEESESRFRTIEPNRERRKKLYARNFGDHADWIRSLPCDDCGASPPSDPSHAVPRGMGGCNSDKTLLRPQCRACHEAYERHEGIPRDEAIRRAGDYWTRSPHYEERDDA